MDIVKKISPESNRIAVVIPVYNEAPFIRHVLETIPHWIHRIVVVDDGSTDNSLEIIRSAADDRTVIVHQEPNQGVGSAIVAGYRRCLELGDQFAVVMGGDGQMDPSDLTSLVEPLLNDTADYVKGNRFLRQDTRFQMPWRRRIGNRALSILTRRALGCYSIGDTQCGFTAISAAAIARIDLDRLYPRYGFPNDMLFQICRHRLRIREIPVRAIYGLEISGINPFINIPEIIFLIVRRGWYRLKNSRRDFALTSHTLPRMPGDSS
ncbi:glycosyltransferase family 2 protein [bacterium]|nr:glycosyltransferase family 2 protein [candidate division CSSED10-310 bacterium]